MHSSRHYITIQDRRKVVQSGVFPGAFGPNQPLGPNPATLDENNPDLFKENMKIVQTHIKHVKTLTSAAQLVMYGRFCLS
jgi:hypothetical protein